MDTITPSRRSDNMRRIRGKGMKPEMAVRRLIHRMGYRYRLHRTDLPGKPDIVFPGMKKVIFVHGCFWHQHDDPACKISRVPKSHKSYWRKKLHRNVIRDKQQIQDLLDAGWDVMIIWECQIENTTQLIILIKNFLS